MLKIISTNPNYLAAVVALPTLEKHPNADRLQVVRINFNTIITSLTAVEGALYVYFPLESVINKEYLAYSNSFENKELNEDQTVKGYFHKTGRVRATRLRGTKSEGYIVPITDVEKWLSTKGVTVDLSTHVGEEFDTIGDILICEKYVVATRSSGEGNGSKLPKKARETKLIEGQFHFHIDTSHLKKNIHKLQPTDIISIGSKYHGSSVILANVLCKKKLTWFQKTLKKFGVPIVDTEYSLVVSSRRVVKNANLVEYNHFYDADIWNIIGERYKGSVAPNITLYGEICGQTPSGRWIQKDYDYGVPSGTCDLFVYRITLTSINGQVYEFTRPQLEAYCEKYGLKVTEGLYYGRAKDLYPTLELGEHWQEEYLLSLMRDYTEKDCHICRNKVPEEGIVLVRESLHEFDAYKLKSFAFLERETKELDTGEVNIEDNQEPCDTTPE